MTLPPLYLEGLRQRALASPQGLDAYKLGIVEAILKDALRTGGHDVEVVRSHLRTALDVVRWEPRPAPPPAPG